MPPREPRLAAIVVALPLLAFVGVVAGIGGGMVVAALQLGISPAAFLDRLHATLPVSYLVVGLAKTPVFAAFIALIACRMGLLVARDERSVGLLCGQDDRRERRQSCGDRGR